MVAKSNGPVEGRQEIVLLSVNTTAKKLVSFCLNSYIVTFILKLNKSHDDIISTNYIEQIAGNKRVILHLMLPCEGKATSDN